MEETNKEEILNTTDTTTVDEVAETTEEEVEQYTENEKRQYARAKKAEAKNKELLEKIKELEIKTNTKVEEKDIKADPKTTDPLETVKLVNALKDLDDVEIEQAQMIADYKKISLSEAVKDEGFKLFFDAKREKDKKANLSQTPNGKQGTVDKKDPFFVKFSQELPDRFDFTKK